MPVARYFCKNCRFVYLEVSEDAESSRDAVMCACGLTAVWTFPPPQVQFRGDGWLTKNSQIRDQMADKNRAVAQRQDSLKREQPGLSLVPNVDGEEVKNWSEAVKLAKDKKKDLSGYLKNQSKEKAGYKP